MEGMEEGGLLKVDLTEKSSMQGSVCSSLTSSSGDSFHVFTDASVGYAPKRSGSRQASVASGDDLYAAERQNLQTEREKLKEERKKLAEEREKLEDERRKLKHKGDHRDATNGDGGDDSVKEEKRIKKKTAKVEDQERRNLEKENKLRIKMERKEQKEREKKPKKLERKSNHSTSSNSRNLSLTSSRDLSNDTGPGLKRVEEEKEDQSLDIIAESNREEAEKRAAEKLRQKNSEDERKLRLEQAREKLQLERKHRQELIRDKISSEQADAKDKMLKQKEVNMQRLKAKQSVDMSDKARTQRAYSWYAKLAQPRRDVFKKKMLTVSNIDITEADVDLLPWNGMGTMVNVSKLNNMLWGT
jgi:myosin heavy subunit